MKSSPIWQIKNIDFLISGLCLVGLVTLTILGVVMRYAVNSPLTWLEEVQMLLIIWLSFFGGSAAFRLQNHVAIEILVDLLPKKLQKVIEVFIVLIVSAVLLFLVIRGYDFVARLAGARRLSNVLRIPYALVYSAVPIGGALMLINFWVAEIKKFLGKTRDENKEIQA